MKKNKTEWSSEIATTIETLKKEGKTHKEMAALMNKAKLRTWYRKLWTTGNIQNFLASIKTETTTKPVTDWSSNGTGWTVTKGAPDTELTSFTENEAIVWDLINSSLNARTKVKAIVSLVNALNS